MMVSSRASRCIGCGRKTLRRFPFRLVLALFPAYPAPLSQVIKEAVRHVHEWWNGRGYPDSLKGEQIPLFARILAVADAFEAMTSDRPYRPALSSEQALAELQRMRGVQFDPGIVDAFCAWAQTDDLVKIEP